MQGLMLGSESFVTVSPYDTYIFILHDAHNPTLIAHQAPYIIFQRFEGLWVLDEPCSH